MIPTEIILEILALLPVKSLLRFTIVCKLWYSIITNPNFITTHLNRFGKANTTQLLIRYYTDIDIDIDTEEHYVLIPDDKSHTKLASPSDTSGRYFSVVGSCNGLVCLCSSYDQHIKYVVIYNPSIHKSVSLTLPYKPQKPYISVIGFGFVSGKSEFKLVRITYHELFDRAKGRYKRLRSEPCMVPLEVEVYEQGGVDWRVIGCAAPPFCVGFTRSQVFLHGAVHWLVYGPTGINTRFQNKIVVFDMCDEVLNDILLPPTLVEYDCHCLSVTLFKDSLALLYGARWNESGYSVWEMRVYGVFESWTNVYNITLPEKVITTLGLRKSGEILFKTDMFVVASYDPKTETNTYISSPRDTRSLTVHDYMESLVLLKCERDVPDWLANPL